MQGVPPSTSSTFLPEQTAEPKRTLRPRLGCNTTLMSLKKKRRWITGHTRGRHKDAVKLLQGVTLSVLQRERDQQVPTRLALGNRRN